MKAIKDMSGAEYYRGQRVRLKRDVDRYPSFIAKKGMEGTIVATPGPDHMNLAVKMDEHLDGAEEWDNEVHWIEDLDMEWVHGDLEIIEPGHRSEFSKPCDRCDVDVPESDAHGEEKDWLCPDCYRPKDDWRFEKVDAEKFPREGGE